MITPKVKDKILEAIVSSKLPGMFLYYERLFPNHEISNDELRLILEQFVDNGLLKTLKLRTAGVYVAFPTADLFDFFNHGGFVAQEELLRANLEKLNLELLKLSKDIEPSKLETINTITSIAGNIATALELFKWNLIG